MSKTKVLLILVLAVVLVITFSILPGCKTTTVETTAAAVETTAAAAETTAAAVKTTSEPIKIGSINHITGLGAPWGGPMQKGIELAVEEINASGGVLGRQVKLIAEDDNTDTDMALQKAKKLAESDKVEAMFGVVWSSIRAAIVTQVADPDKVPFFYPTYNEDGSTLANLSRYYICTGAIPNQQLKEFIPYLIKNYGKKIYLVGIDEVMTTESWKYIEKNKLVENAGGSIVGKDITAWEVGDWSSVLQRIQKSGADIVFPYIGGSEMINLVKQFYDFGMNKNIKLASTYLDETFVPDFPEELREGILATASYFQSLDTPRNKEFVAAFQKKFGDKIGISNVVEGSYNSVWLWKLAVEKAGKVDKEAMLDALPTVVFDAPQGQISVAPVSQHTNLHSFIAECQKDGTFKILVDLGLVAPELSVD
ncbi:MAG: substrate-binding protein [Candidatus Humimicrobiaceae bacterium]